MSRALDDLCAGELGHFNIRSAVIETIARCAERRVFLYVTDTLRTVAEQEINVRRGFSRTMDSRHLAQKGCGKSHACDVVPVLEANDGRIIKLDWDAESPEWLVIWEEADTVGLQAGFKNASTGKRWDLGHLQEAP